jgi:hypothetical protein
LLNLANLDTGQGVEGIVLTYEIAGMTATQPQAIQSMNNYHRTQLAGAILITACDEMSIERSELFALVEGDDVPLDDFLTA